MALPPIGGNFSLVDLSVLTRGRVHYLCAQRSIRVRLKKTKPFAVV